MSFRVLVIPEDPTFNGHILAPLVRALMTDVGRPSARVQVLGNPRVQGYAHARQAILNRLPSSYRWYDLWLFFPDADRVNDDAMRRLEAELGTQTIALLCCAAQPEVEIYACAAFRRDLREMERTWADSRTNPRFKEEIFEPLLTKHGNPDLPDEGRERMTTQSVRNLPLLYRLCPELKDLRDRIVALLEDQ